MLKHIKLKSRFFGMLIISSILGLTAFPKFIFAGQGSEGKVAVVNGSVIIQGDFDREMSRVRQRILSTGKSLDDAQQKTIRTQVLDGMIKRELLYQESQNRGIKIEEKTVTKEFTNLKKRFPNEDAFKLAMKKVHLDEATLKVQIKKGIAIQQFIDEHFSKKVQVTGREIKAYYDNNLNSFKKPEQVRASHILIKVDPSASESEKAAAKEKIYKIQQKLKEGEEFGKLARKFSEGPSKAKDGDLGYFNRGQMVKPFSEAAFNLAPGNVSDIIETRFGYHLITVIDKKPESVISYENVKEKLRQRIKGKKVKEKLDTYMEGLKDRSKVEIFMKDKS